MDSAQILIVNIEIFCLLGLLIFSLAGAIQMLLVRRCIGRYIIVGLCLLLIAVWSFSSINQQVIAAQDINPECLGHSDPRNKDCSRDLSSTLTSSEIAALRRADIFWDTMKCVIVPSILGVGAALYIMRQSTRHTLEGAPKR